MPVTDHDDLLAAAVRRRQSRPWLHITSDGQAHFYLRSVPHSIEDMDLAAALRAALAARPQPLFEGSMEALHFWSERRMEDTGAAGEPVVVYAAVAGSATPTDSGPYDEWLPAFDEPICTCPGGGGPDDLEHRPSCPLNPYPAAAGSATPTEDDDD
jgi:hypothetical protein